MQSILESIRYNNGMFPHNELQQLIQNKDGAIPHLLSIVEEVIDIPDAYIDESSRIDLLYALYLLAQFRETRVYPLLIKLLSLPDDLVDAFLGECITEGAGRMLASVCTDDIYPIQQLIENEENGEFVRGQGLHALVILVLHGKLSREWTINYFRELLAEKSSDEYPTFNAHIISSIADLHPQEAYEDIKCAYEKRAVDSMMIDLDDINRIMNTSKDAVIEKSRNNHHFQYIEDTIREMEWWACFEQKPKKNMFPSKSVQVMSESRQKKINPAIKIEKVGRNDPCSCGSGQKYKKCCGR